VAYLVNSYPAPSQSFIRRELAALEQGGMRVRRYTVRRWAGELVDPADRAERERTRCVLGAGPVALVAATVACMVTRPVAFWSAACLAARVARRSDRGYVAHAAYLVEACVVARWAKRDGIRHIHAHFGTNSTTVAMLCHAAGGPAYSFTAHGPEEFDRAWTIALTEKVRRSRFAVAISEFGRSQFYYKCDPADWPKVRLVRCAVDDRFLPADDAPAAQHAAARPPTAEARVVSVGRLAPEKGQLILLEACARVVASGVPLSLEIIGDGPLRPVLEAEIARLGLAGHVTLSGWQPGERVREALLSARALVMPSFAEGLPVVIMEALALHRPVVATYVAGIPELVQPGTCGWLVPAGSVEAMAAALREVLAASPARLAEMGDRGAELVGRYHRAATEAAKLRRMFVECVSGGPEPERPVAELAPVRVP
jgi:glycosyltransferase involved in cell wall biosynthesis